MHENEMSPQLKRVRYWIERLENKASTLLDGLPVEEMPPKHQADVALKCLDYLQRFTSIEKTLQDAAQISENKGMLSAFKRQARGEMDGPKEGEQEQESMAGATPHAGGTAARPRPPLSHEDEEEEWNEAADKAFDEMWRGKERISEEYSAPYQEEDSCGCSPQRWQQR